MASQTREKQPASPGAAAVLSFLLPGLGQLALGAFRRAFLLGIPLVALIVLTIFLLVVDKGDVIGALVKPDVVMALVVLDVLLGLIHLIAIGDAYRLARRRVSRSAWTLRPGAPRLLVILLVATFGIHGALGALGVQAFNAMNTVYQSPGSSFNIPQGSFAPDETLAPGATPFQVSAFPGPQWAADGRLNVLLIGGDAGPGRWSLRTDTLILLSADVATGKVALFGFPRNLVGVPLAPEDSKAGATFDQDFINALWVYADARPGKFPGDDASRGFRAITGAIQQLAGVPIDGAIVVKLNGFVDLVDALGGVWIDVPFRMYDPEYPNEDGSGHQAITINAGCQLLHGHKALAFARIRHIDSDYYRMGRQQAVLEALARQLDPISLITQVPTLLGIAGNNLKTTFQPDDVGQLARFAAELNRTNIKNVLFNPPKYPEYLTGSEILRIQKVVRNVFVVAPKASPDPSASPAPTKTPKPTAEPCPPN
jgi:polyisoprenyl-teichoic acid--peptidoglycan teichoic acid transferase